MTTDWMLNDKLFISQLLEGRKWELFAAFQFVQAGYTVCVPPLSIRHDVSERHKYAKNELDLLVGRWLLKPIRAEVKSRNLRFTSPDDYPYPTAFVDTQSSWEAKAIKPAIICLISQDTGKILGIPASTSSLWRSVEKTDRVRQITDIWLEIPKDQLIGFDKITDWLDRKLAARG